MFKFVLTRGGELLILIGRNAYHQDTGVPTSQVRSAGYIDFDLFSEGPLKVVLSKESIGYRMGVRYGDEERVNECLASLGYTYDMFDKEAERREYDGIVPIQLWTNKQGEQV